MKVQADRKVVQIGRRKKKKNKFLKRALFIAGALSTLLILGIISFPFVIDFIPLGTLSKLYPEVDEITREKIYDRFFSIPEPTKFFAENGEIIGELFESYAELVPYSDIPPYLVQAFIAAEDEDFFRHKGVNPKAIMRAILENIKEGRITQGGSTITQQLARNLFLSRERTITRKLKEVAYALKIERELEKEEILSLYLSSIFFGNGSWGIKSAVRNYFGKSLSEITLAESALLASLPKSPVYYSPIKYPEKARKRQMWVLARMRELGFITEEEYETAKNEKIKVYVWKNRLNDYFWYSEHIRREFINIVGDQDEAKMNFSVLTTLDTDCYKIAQKSLRWGLERIEVMNQKELARKIGDVKINTSLEAIIFPDGEKIYKSSDELYEGEVVEAKKSDISTIKVKLRKIKEDEIRGSIKGLEESRENISKEDFNLTGYILPEIAQYIKVREGERLILKRCVSTYFCPIPKKVEVEGAIVVINPNDGKVLCMVGGYDSGNSQFIRSVQAKRQVGSAFKPIVYAAAIESGLFTPATLVKDTPVVMEGRAEGTEEVEEPEASDSEDLKGDENKMKKQEGPSEWKPKNFSQFLGFITLQEALAKSINAATVRVAQEIGLLRIKDMMRRVGIKDLGPYDLTIALGSISMSPLELASAYAPFANGGNKITPYFIKRIEKKGQVIYESKPEIEQVISPQISFIMAWMMRNVVLHGTGWRAKVLKMPVAGKTGTSNLGRDAWFVGFTPEIVVVVWVGKDDFTPIGNNVASGPSAALPIFVEFMREYGKKLKNIDFDVPEGIEFAKVDPITGEISNDRFYLMAFTKGTIPTPDGKKEIYSDQEDEEIESEKKERDTQKNQNEMENWF